MKNGRWDSGHPLDHDKNRDGKVQRNELAERYKARYASGAYDRGGPPGGPMAATAAVLPADSRGFGGPPGGSGGYRGGPPSMTSSSSGSSSRADPAQRLKLRRSSRPPRRVRRAPPALSSGSSGSATIARLKLRRRAAQAIRHEQRRHLPARRVEQDAERIAEGRPRRQRPDHERRTRRATGRLFQRTRSGSSGVGPSSASTSVVKLLRLLVRVRRLVMVRGSVSGEHAHAPRKAAP